MQVIPDRKLLTKQWLILLTVSAFELITAGIIHLAILLITGIVTKQTAVILWLITCGVVLLQGIIAVPLIYLWIKNLSYRIEDERVTIFKGILTKVQQNIPYRAVTDFMLQRTIYDRLLGIGSICIQTAGQSLSATGYEGQLSGLVNFDNLHRNLRSKLKTLHPQSESAAVAEPDASDADTVNAILQEIKAIRSLLEKK